jgi:hypothetical protein
MVREGGCICLLEVWGYEGETLILYHRTHVCIGTSSRNEDSKNYFVFVFKSQGRQSAWLPRQPVLAITSDEERSRLRFQRTFLTKNPMYTFFCFANVVNTVVNQTPESETQTGYK